MNAKHLFGVAVGGAVYGFIEKKFTNLPTLPVIGRAGTIAAIGYFLGRKGGGMAGGIIRDTTLAAAVIAGYQLGSTGKISGDVDGDIADQIHGIAAQV